MSDFSEKNPNEVSDVSNELKNKIRRERALVLIDNKINQVNYNGHTFYNSKPKTAFYKDSYHYSLKGVTEDDILKAKDEKIKSECIEVIKSINLEYENLKDMDVNLVLLETYKYFLVYMIKSFSPSFETKDITIDDLEEKFDELIDGKMTDDEELNRIIERCKVSNDK